MPMLYDLLRKLLKREFGSDLLGGISIVTSLLLGEFLAGSIIVLTLAGGWRITRYVVLLRCWPRWQNGCPLSPTANRNLKSCTSDLDSANLGRVRHRILEQNAERERRELAQIKR